MKEIKRLMDLLKPLYTRWFAASLRVAVPFPRRNNGVRVRLHLDLFVADDPAGETVIRQ